MENVYPMTFRLILDILSKCENPPEFEIMNARLKAEGKHKKRYKNIFFFNFLNIILVGFLQIPKNLELIV